MNEIDLRKGSNLNFNDCTKSTESELISYRIFFLVEGTDVSMVSFHQEKRLRVNMGLKKLREKVKEQQEKVEKVCIFPEQTKSFSYVLFGG